MGLLDSEAGKRRLLTVEIPVVERYNEGRDVRELDVDAIVARLDEAVRLIEKV